jgi:nucleotidyltransferase substrate binding protein (TIGR01987 family)
LFKLVNKTLAMQSFDIRWEQRFANYNKALSQLTKFIEQKKLNELEEQGLIQAFEYTFELAWNVIKDYYLFQGETGIQGSRDAFRMAFSRGLINNGEEWMKMIESRSRTSHTYNEETAKEIANAVRNKYFDMFIDLQETLTNIRDGKSI